MTWDIDKSQPYTVIDIHIPTGLLTVVLASQDEVRHKWLFQEISKKEKMEVIHVLSAADPVAIQYPSKIKLYVCSMYDKNAQTMQTLLRFWDGCLQAARDGEAVVIHSKTGFCRAPLAMAAIMIMAGHSLHNALMEIRKRRNIYEGLLLPWESWPQSHKIHSLSWPLCECYNLISMELDTTGKVSSRNDAKECGNISTRGNISTGGLKRARSVNPCKNSKNTFGNIAHVTAQRVSVQCFEKITTFVDVIPGSRDKRPRKERFCPLCHVSYTNLRQCWECNRWACRSCSFWCTFCPADVKKKYTICSNCYECGTFLMRQKNTWCCTSCGQ